VPQQHLFLDMANSFAVDVVDGSSRVDVEDESGMDVAKASGRLASCTSHAEATYFQDHSKNLIDSH